MHIKNSQILITLLGVFLLQSCKSNGSDNIFQISELGICEQIDTLYIGVPLNMVVNNNDLFIGDFREPMIVHYNLQNGEIKRFLTEGRGPQETLPPIILYANPFEDTGLYRYSKQAFEIGYYPFDSLSLYVPLLNSLPYEYQNIVPFKKDRYLAVGIFMDGYRYRILNEEGMVIHSFGYFPDFVNNEYLNPIEARAMFHQVKFANNYYRKKLVAASKHVVDIIDYSASISNESIKRILLAPYDYEYTTGNFLKASGKKGTVLGAISVACDNSYIYILFSPSIIGEQNQNVSEEIWIFDWDGQPVKKLIPNVANLIMIAADAANGNSVFGLAYSRNDQEEYYHIVKINI